MCCFSAAAAPAHRTSESSALNVDPDEEILRGLPSLQSQTRTASLVSLVPRPPASCIRKLWVSHPLQPPVITVGLFSRSLIVSGDLCNLLL